MVDAARFQEEMSDKRAEHFDARKCSRLQMALKSAPRTIAPRHRWSNMVPTDDFSTHVTILCMLVAVVDEKQREQKRRDKKTRRAKEFGWNAKGKKTRRGDSDSEAGSDVESLEDYEQDGDVTSSGNDSDLDEEELQQRIMRRQRRKARRLAEQERISKEKAKLKPSYMNVNVAMRRAKQAQCRKYIQIEQKRVIDAFAHMRGQLATIEKQKLIDGDEFHKEPFRMFAGPTTAAHAAGSYSHSMSAYYLDINFLCDRSGFLGGLWRAHRGVWRSVE